METILSQKPHYIQIYSSDNQFIKEIDLGRNGLFLLGSEKGYKKDFEQENIILYKVTLSQFEL